MLQIRDFIEEDRQAYLEMARDFYSSDASLFELEEQKLEDTFNIGVKGSPLMRGLTLCEQEKPVGYALLAFYWSCEAGGVVVQAEELYFIPQSRGKGYGHQYFQWLFAEYPQAKRFRLEVCPYNPKAKKLYEQLGFEMLNYGQMILDR